MGRQLTSIRPFQRLYVDILGPYPRSKSVFIGLLIVLDHLTKFHWVCPLKNFTASKILEFMEKQVFHLYGVPEVVVSDNGSQFKGSEFNAFLTKYGISHMYTALYSPQSNSSERVNRSLIAGIRAYLKQDHKLWDQQLSSISCALRNSYHQSLKISPYHAVFGFNMITHGTSYSLLRNLKLLDEEAYERNKSHYNLRSKVPLFSIGQEVFRRNFAQSCQDKSFNAKLAPLFIKAKIRESCGSHYYVLEDLGGKIIGTFHAKDIRA